MHLTDEETEVQLGKVRHTANVVRKMNVTSNLWFSSPTFSLLQLEEARLHCSSGYILEYIFHSLCVCAFILSLTQQIFTEHLLRAL